VGEIETAAVVRLAIEEVEKYRRRVTRLFEQREVAGSPDEGEPSARQKLLEAPRAYARRYSVYFSRNVVGVCP